MNRKLITHYSGNTAMQQNARALLQQRQAQRIAKIKQQNNCRDALFAALTLYNKLTRQISLNCDDLS